MGKTAIKICGLQSVGMLESMINLPVDYIGFVFAKSKRQVTPEQANEMIRYINTQQTFAPLTAGVFVNPTQTELMTLLETVPIDVVQLHGHESPELCRWVRDTFSVRVIKVIAIMNAAGNREQQSAEQQMEPYRGFIDAVLLDTYDPLVGGGTGKTFAWACIPSYQEAARKFQLPLFIAGGLDPDNVAQLITEYGPDGVDVSSGVETDGKKDIDKITAFVERVRNHG